ncbi:sulfurtransferase [Mariniluteicoccus endophyticus]
MSNHAARLITAAELAQIKDAPGVVVLDATTILVQPAGDGYYTTSSGRETFEQGHIPGARFADLLEDLADRDDPKEFTVLPPEEFAQRISALGVSNDTTVVVYDQGVNMWATRLWWNLRLVGHDDILVLDGGLPAWRSEGHEIATGPADAVEPVTFTAHPRPELYASADDVAAAIDDPSRVLVNSLDHPTFTGERHTYARPGRIPGSLHIPFPELSDADGRAKDVDTFRAVGDAAAVADGDATPIAYCGGGIAATYVAFQLARAGRDDVAVYDGSLTEWAADESRPLVTGKPA